MTTLMAGLALIMHMGINPLEGLLLERIKICSVRVTGLKEEPVNFYLPCAKLTRPKEKGSVYTAIFNEEGKVVIQVYKKMAGGVSELIYDVTSHTAEQLQENQQKGIPRQELEKRKKPEGIAI